MSAASAYTALVDRLLEQRTRLRGPQPSGDLFGRIAPDSPLLKADPRRALGPNLQVMSSYVEPDDIVIDVGGGGGRNSLPLALRCREVINVDESAGMGAGFVANASAAGIENARFVLGNWLEIAPPSGDVVLVNHVTYLTREIVPFIERLQASAGRRVVITLNSQSFRNRALYQLAHGEVAAPVPGPAELLNVLWELGISPGVHELQEGMAAPPPSSTRAAAVDVALAALRSDQWAQWPLGEPLESRVRGLVEDRFDALFAPSDDGFLPRWLTPSREVLITWTT
jgi:SAM-dependent methyltransferase